MAKDKFLRGAIILTAAGLIVKMIGSVNRILLSRLLGGEGIGLYQMAYPAYLLLLSLSAAGIPMAISIIVAEHLARNEKHALHQVFRVSLKLLMTLGAVLGLGLFLAAGFLVSNGYIRDPRAYYALIALAPAIFFGTVLACFRGFFQGHQIMTPPAVSLTAEQAVRVVTMLSLAYLLIPYGIEYAAAGAAFGTVPGSLIGLIILGLWYRRYSRIWQYENQPLLAGQEEVRPWALAKKLLILALPVSCANIMVPLTNIVDAIMVPNCLVKAGFSVVEATTMFGYLAGMALPLILMATIPTTSLTQSVLPAVREAYAHKHWQNIDQKANLAMKLCCVLTLPAAVGMSVMAEPLSLLLYGTSKAGQAIMHSGPAIFFLGLQQVTTGILQGMDYIFRPMFNMVFGLAIKIALVLMLTDASFHVMGAAWSTNINFLAAALLNIYILRSSRITFNWLQIAKIACSSLLMGIIAMLLQPVLAVCLRPNLATIMTILIASLVYGALLLGLKVVTRDEMKYIPIIKKFVK